MNKAPAISAPVPGENKLPVAGQARKLASVPATGSDTATDAHDWQEMIATAAYYRAQKRGFEGGSPEEDWFEAEAELRDRFARGGGI